MKRFIAQWQNIIQPKGIFCIKLSKTEIMSTIFYNGGVESSGSPALGGDCIIEIALFHAVMQSV